MLLIPQAIYDQIRRHGETVYPHECCGILLGAIHDTSRTVVHALPIPNSSPTPHNRYEIAPIDLIQADRQARQSGLEIVGFYHSHPNHPAKPSTSDLAEAHWLGCTYFITAVVQGRATASRAFHLSGKHEEDKLFESEEIQVLE